MKTSHFFILLLALACLSCSSSRIIKPLDRNETSVSAGVGGPLIEFEGITIPVPLSSVTGAYGVDSNLTLFAGVHTTSLLFGVIHADIGGVRELITPKKWRPGISAAASFHLLIDKWEGNARFYPQLDANAYWNYTKNDNFFYLGASGWFELNSIRAHEQPQETIWIPMVNLGHQFERPSMSYGLEVKYIHPFKDNRDIVVDYIGLGNRGSLGVYFTISKRF